MQVLIKVCRFCLKWRIGGTKRMEAMSGCGVFINPEPWIAQESTQLSSIFNPGLQFPITLQGSGIPIPFNAMVDILDALFLLLHSADNAVMRPTQFRTQCVTNRESKIELPDIT